MSLDLSRQKPVLEGIWERPDFVVSLPNSSSNLLFHCWTYLSSACCCCFCFLSKSFSLLLELWPAPWLNPKPLRLPLILSEGADRKGMSDTTGEKKKPRVMISLVPRPSKANFSHDYGRGGGEGRRNFLCVIIIPLRLCNILTISPHWQSMFYSPPLMLC